MLFGCFSLACMCCPPSSCTFQSLKATVMAHGAHQVASASKFFKHTSPLADGSGCHIQQPNIVTAFKTPYVQPVSNLASPYTPAIQHPVPLSVLLYIPVSPSVTGNVEENEETSKSRREAAHQAANPANHTATLRSLRWVHRHAL